MIDLKQDCEMVVLSQENLVFDFDCGDEDLNEFFNRDAIEYKRQMLASTCFFRHKTSGVIVCAFAFSASSIKMLDLPSNRRKKVREYIPREKTLRAYPAILIGRLGVSLKFTGQGIGSQLMDAIKLHCLDNFPDFVRFLLLDAYNKPEVLKFYQKNDFLAVFSSEEQEREAYKQDISEPLHTRYLFYDMINLKNALQ